MIDILKNSFERNADKVAFRTDSEEITYKDLWTISKRYAYSLTESERPVIVKGGKQIHMLAGFIACLMCSRAYIPCDEDIPPIRLKYLKDISGADTIIDVTYTPADETLEYFENNNDSIAYIIFTSGSTGKPKGVPISRNNLKAFLTKFLLKIPALCEQSGGIVLNQARFSFDLSVADIYFSLCSGSTLYALSIESIQNPEELLKSLSGCGASSAVFTPTFAKYCLCMPEFDKKLLPNLKCIFFCGETLEPNTVRKLFDRFEGIKIINAYGPTEATCAVCGVEITLDMCDMDYLPVGHTNMITCDIEIHNNEIFLRGDSVFSNYLGEKPLEGMYATGDRGEIKDGYIYCFGRKYGYVKYKGHRIEPDEIKNVMMGIEGIEQCEVIAVKNANNTVTGIMAKVVSFVLDEATVKARLYELLPDYMIPKTIKIYNKISFNENGKQKI